MANSSSLIDKRIVQRSIRKGLLDREQYQRMLDELPDLSDNIAEAVPFSASEGREPETTNEEARASDEPPLMGDREGLQSGADAVEEPIQAGQPPRTQPMGEPQPPEKLEAKAGEREAAFGSSQRAVEPGAGSPLAEPTAGGQASPITEPASTTGVDPETAVAEPVKSG